MNYLKPRLSRGSRGLERGRSDSRLVDARRFCFLIGRRSRASVVSLDSLNVFLPRPDVPGALRATGPLPRALDGVSLTVHARVARNPPGREVPRNIPLVSPRLNGSRASVPAALPRASAETRIPRSLTPRPATRRAHVHLHREKRSAVPRVPVLRLMAERLPWDHG